MAYVSKEDIERAREMDLLTYLQMFEPHNLVRLSPSTYCTKEHDSLKISNGLWHWYSRGIGGRSALDYLIKVEGMSLPEAVEQLLEGVPVYTVPKAETPKPKPFCLPPRNEDNRRIIAYLRKRGIDMEIIRHCIDSGILYESSDYHNAVFVGKDLTGEPRYAFMRGTWGPYKMEAAGSDKTHTFRIAVEENTPVVRVFESAVDALSYATLMKLHGQNWKNADYLSLGGVSMGKGDIPKALSSYLGSHEGVRRVELLLDNDDPGRTAASLIYDALQERYEVFIGLPPNGKDFNEYLCSLNTKEIER